jgi:glycosyltransferase involved in cell wall biosynthesis
MKIAWIPCTVRNGKGYDRVWHKLGQAMANLGVELADTFDTAAHLRVPLGYPRAWYLLVYHTMWETNRIPGEWLPVLNRARAVWAPSAWVRDTFVACGVRRPVYVSGYGVDPDEFPTIERDPARPFTFMAMGRFLGDRKGVLDVIRAFGELNLPDAWLYVKVSDIPFSRVADQPRIEMANLHVNRAELAYRMATADCFVYPSKGEGFGLEPLEAMCAGTCAIVTAHSGMLDYIQAGVCLPLPVTGTQAAQVPPFDGLGEWAAVDLEALKDKMWWAYRHREACWEMGRRAAAYVRAGWTWRQAAQKAVVVLRNVLETEA